MKRLEVVRSVDIQPKKYTTPQPRVDKYREVSPESQMHMYEKT